MASVRYKKILIIVVPILAIIFFVFLYFSLGFGVKVEDTRRMRDVRRTAEIYSIKEKMEIYFNKHNSKYLQSTTTPTSIEETIIPKDPNGKSYGWIDNTSDSQKFCVWAKLEKKVAYYIASHCGVKEANQQPTSLDECCELSKP
jgi:hypothetical protein